VIGMPVNHRPDPRFDGAIGCFVNTLAVRFHPDPTQPFDAFLASARRSLVDGYHHRAVPFDRVVGALGLAGTGAAAPIDVVFVQNRPTVAPRLRGLQVTARRDDSRPPRFDLEVHVDAAGGPLVVSWIYDRELFDDWRIAQLAAHYARFLEHVAADPRQPLGDVALVTADERSQLLDGWDPEAPPLPVVAAVSAGV
jgi:non-ribosomal peptide synthetase component F